MVFVSASLFLLASVLPSVMGLTLDTPADTESNGAIAVTWKTVATDPKFTILLVDQDNKESIDAQTGVDPTLLKQTVNLGTVTPGNYILQAVNADDIEVPLSTSGAFKIGAAGSIAAAGAGGNNAAAGGAVAGAGGAAAATCPPPTTVTVTAAAGAATGAASTGAASTGAASGSGAAAAAAAAQAATAAKAGKGKGAAQAAAAKGKGAAQAAAAKGKAAAAAAKAKSPFGKNVGRSLFSAKFGRRELFRD
ncbi:hypothetical protein FB45DRAFT_1011176 [Roridomyces roridus]|uniref:Uncharacterized protein n=1 Tax=Roridomyces roridus TaxID=1738132 RepID=A0AAD7B2J7_9AGAR|nr:hypothetical protein FB45DRAFT_1011176 [Roridomyces roridus]